jgi:hypothetical protein
LANPGGFVRSRERIGATTTSHHRHSTALAEILRAAASTDRASFGIALPRHLID